MIKAPSLNPSRGSILIEALVSIVILSVSVTIIIQSMTSSMRAVVQAERLTESANILESYLAESLLSPGKFADGKSETLNGFCGDYLLRMSRVGQRSADSDAKHFLLAVSWGEENDKNELSSEIVLESELRTSDEFK